MLLRKEFDPILCSHSLMIAKLNFIILKTLERLSICLLKEVMFRWRIPKPYHLGHSVH